MYHYSVRFILLMNKLRDSIQIILDTLETKPHIEEAMIQSFRNRLREDSPIIQAENPQDHFCVLFLPYHRQTNSVFLVHHKKANDWIPPGGHIEDDEYPLDSVMREFYEELGVVPHASRIELFDIDQKDIQNPAQTCTLHRHIWYLVHTEKCEYVWDQGEFYDAGWFDLAQGLAHIKHNKSYKRTLRKLTDWSF